MGRGGGEKGRGGRWSQSEVGPKLIFLKNLVVASQPPNHSDGQEGVGQLIKIVFSYDSHISLADGRHVFPHAKDVN